MAQFDRNRLPLWEVGLRLGLAALVMFANPWVYVPAIIASIGWVALHHMTNRRQDETAEEGTVVIK